MDTVGIHAPHPDLSACLIKGDEGEQAGIHSLLLGMKHAFRWGSSCILAHGGTDA